MKHRRLQELDRSDFEIVKGEPDYPWLGCEGYRWTKNRRGGRPDR